MTKIVNSWNDWDPLKHVIVGRCDNSCVPPEEPATSEKVPDLNGVTAYVSAELAKDPTRPVVVQGDAQVSYDSVIQLMNALKQGGVKSVGLVTEPVAEK